MKRTFRTEPLYLLPVLASLLFGLFCASLVLESAVDLYTVTPFPEGVAGSLGNGLYFVILTGVGASLLYALLKRKSLRIVTLITGFALSAAAFMLTVIYLYAAFSIFPIPYAYALVLILATLATAFVDISVFRGHSGASNAVILFLGGALGAFLGFSIPAFSAMLILAFLAIYDVYAVYRGPVGKIAQGGLERLRGLSFSFKDVQMGLGDLTFYSMLTSLVFVNAGPLLCIASIVGVLIGVLLALKMLERKGIFPGLPFPIILGLLPLIVSLYL